MQWEVSGVDLTTGEERVLVVDAEDEASARRRGGRRGLAVEGARAVAPVMSAAPVLADSVGYAYVAPTPRRRGRLAKPRKRTGSGGYGVAAVVALAIAGGIGYAVYRSGAFGDSSPRVAPLVDPPVTAPPRVSALAATVTPAAPAIPTLAATLIHAYANDPAAADHEYKGRLISVTGEVETTGKGLFGTTCIGLRKPGSTEGGVRVQCAFDEGDLSALDGAHKGDTVTIVGHCRGMDGDIELANCRLTR